MPIFPVTAEQWTYRVPLISNWFTPVHTSWLRIVILENKSRQRFADG